MRAPVVAILPLLIVAVAAAQSTQPTSRFAGVHVKNDDDGGYELRLTVAGQPHVRTLEAFDDTTLPEAWEEVTIKVVDQPPLVAKRGEFIVIKNGQLYRHTREGP